MRYYNSVFKVLLVDLKEIVVTPTICKKLIDAGQVLEMEQKAFTDDQFNELIEWEVNNNYR
jgi:hypothetical protein